MAFTGVTAWSSGSVTSTMMNARLNALLTELQTFLTPTHLTSTGSITPGTNITCTVVDLMNQGGWIGGIIRLVPTGSFATVTTAASGNLASDLTLCTLPASWRPYNVTGIAQENMIQLRNSTNDVFWNCNVGSAGTVLAVSSLPSVSLVSTDVAWDLYIPPFLAA